MPWVLAIEDRSEAKIRVRLICEGETIDHADVAYGDIHIVPCVEDGDTLNFCAHDFNRQCYCHPEVVIEVGQRPVVKHFERKPN